MESVLKWGIENSAPGTGGAQTKLVSRPTRRYNIWTYPGADIESWQNTEALAQLFGAADDATLMKEAMAAINDPNVAVEDKLIAFDNLEMLCEGLDNAVGLPLFLEFHNVYLLWCPG